MTENIFSLRKLRAELLSQGDEPRLRGTFIVECTEILAPQSDLISLPFYHQERIESVLHNQ